MTYESFIGRFEKATKTTRGVIVRCPAHEDSTASLSIGRSSNNGVLLKCFAGCSSEAIVGALGLTMRDLFATEPVKSFTAPATRAVINNGVKPVIEKIYSYTDAIGRELYQAIRLKPKSFRQRHSVNGQWIWNMDGVERVLYRLPEVQKAETVWIVEGEKDADNLAAISFCATCNVGGAGKWLDGYTETLKGKKIILCGDNDDAGVKHMELVFDSISPAAASVKILKLPKGVKDVSDYLQSLDKDVSPAAILQELVDAATPHLGGIKMPVYSMADLERGYKAHVDQSSLVSLNLADWLPSLNRIRPVVRGEMVLVIGDTGSGKTALLQNIALKTKLNTLLFEMELPSELIFERFFAIHTKQTCQDIEIEYRNNGCFGEKTIMERFPHLFVCSESRITLENLEQIICRSELKIGAKPALVLIDYVQLIQGDGSRYEKTSNIAEGLKVLAKATRTIIVVASQVSRASGDDEIGLHSAKDSGALENSAGLVLGAWRTEKDPTLLTLKILKSTKGGAGLTIPCNFDGPRMLITERSKIEHDS